MNIIKRILVKHKFNRALKKGKEISLELMYKLDDNTTEILRRELNTVTDSIVEYMYQLNPTDFDIALELFTTEAEDEDITDNDIKKFVRNRKNSDYDCEGKPKQRLNKQLNKKRKK